MSPPGSKSIGNMPILETTTDSRRNKLLKIREQHTRCNRNPVNCFVARYFVQSSTCAEPISKDNLPTSHNHISSTGTCSGLWIQCYWWNQYESRMSRTTFWWQWTSKELKDKSKFFLHFQILELCWVLI